MFTFNAIARQSINAPGAVSPKGVYRLRRQPPQAGYLSARTMFPALLRRSVPNGCLPPQYHLMFTFNAIARQSISAQGAVSRRVSTALRSQRPNWVPERRNYCPLQFTKAQCPEGCLPPWCLSVPTGYLRVGPLVTLTYAGWVGGQKYRTQFVT